MTKSSKSKSKIVVASPPSRSRAAVSRARNLFELVLPVVGGAIVVMLVFSFFKFGANEIWSPFAVGGSKIFKGLATSALAGGIATAILGRRLDGPLAAMGCALGWALWGWSLHFGAQGRYLNFLPGGLPAGVPASFVFSNAISQSLCVAFSLLIASAVSWFWVRRTQKGGFAADNVGDDDRAGNGLKSFSTAFMYPLSTAIGGVFLLIFFGLLTLPLGEPTVGQLPSGPGVALWCGLLAMTALAVATTFARRIFRAIGSIGDVVVAPLAVGFVAMIFGAALGQMPLMRPAALLLWHTSGFEMASWAALGAALGYYFARAKPRNN